ncbi:MAG: insulinase family protein [Pelosinus sp.]|nr:insulinase family protein [Pelosinus sp.]
MYFKSVLPNGMRIVSETIPYVKSVTLGVWVGTGSRSEQKYNHGISHFIEHLMFKGTVSRSAKDIAEAVDAVGGQLNAFTAKEHTCYYAKVLDTHADLAMDMLSDMLLSSKFDEEDIKRERGVVLEEVKMYEDSPDELVHDIHLSRIWQGHALGRNILGSVESINSFDRALVMDYYQQFYTPDNMVVAAAGNISHEALVDLVQKYFGAFSGKKQKLTAVQPVLKPMHTVQSKETEQVHLCIGTVSVPYHSPEIYILHILNNILGGGISSRLFQSVREERGLAYSIYSYQSNYSDAGLFNVYAGTRPANAKQVIDLILENIVELRDKPVSAKELSRNKEQLKGSILLGLESSSSRMSRVGKMEINNRYLTIEEVVARIEQVTSEDLQRLAARLFDASLMSFTALGPVDDTLWSENLSI